jgi:protein TonB
MLVILLLILISDRFISAKQPFLVIDFTLEEPARATFTGPAASGTRHIPARRSHDTENAVPQHDAVAPEPTTDPLPVYIPSADVSPPTMTESLQAKKSVYSAGTGRAEKGIPSGGGSDATAGDMKSSTITSPGNDNGAGKAKYLKANFAYIKEMINRHIVYPKIARQMGWQGKVKISFIIASDGHAKGITIAQSSGFGALDISAVEAVEKSSPFPRPPAEAQIIIPIFYQLN